MRRSYGDGGADRRVVLIVLDDEVVVLVVEDRVGRAREPQGRRGVRITRELLADLFDVVVVDVAVAAGPDEVADLEAGLWPRPCA